MIKTAVNAVNLALVVGFLAFASDDPYNVTLPVVPVFFLYSDSRCSRNKNQQSG